MKKWFKRLGWVLLFVLLVLGAGLYFLPSLVSTEPALQRIVSTVNQSWDGELRLDDWDWHWTKAGNVYGIEAQLPDGTMVNIERMVCSNGWWHILRHKTWRELVLVKPQVKIPFPEKPTTEEKPMPEDVPEDQPSGSPAETEPASTAKKTKEKQPHIPAWLEDVKGVFRVVDGGVQTQRDDGSTIIVADPLNIRVDLNTSEAVTVFSVVGHHPDDDRSAVLLGEVRHIPGFRGQTQWQARVQANLNKQPLEAWQPILSVMAPDTRANGMIDAMLMFAGDPEKDGLLQARFSGQGLQVQAPATSNQTVRLGTLEARAQATIADYTLSEVSVFDINSDLGQVAVSGALGLEGGKGQANMVLMVPELLDRFPFWFTSVKPELKAGLQENLSSTAGFSIDAKTREALLDDVRVSFGKELLRGQARLGKELAVEGVFSPEVSMIERLGVLPEALSIQGIKPLTMDLLWPFDPDRANERKARFDLGLDQLAFNGVSAHAVAGDLALSNGVARVVVTGLVNQGTLQLASTVTQATQPKKAQLVFDKGTLLSKANITDEMINSWLGNVHPLLKNSKVLHGNLGVEMGTNHFPLGALPDGMSFVMKVVLQDVELASTGFFEQLRPLLKIRESSYRISNETFKVTCSDGVMRYAPITLWIDHQPVQLFGEVSFDQSMRFVTRIPITEKWFGKEVAGFLKEAHIDVPVTGTVESPKLDTRALTSALAKAGKEAFTEEVKQELKQKANELLQDIFK